MTKYAILIYEDPAFYESLSPEEWPAIVGAHGTFVEQVSELGGCLRAGTRWCPRRLPPRSRVPAP